MSYNPYIFLSIGAKIHLESVDPKYINDMLDDVNEKIEEYTIKIEQYNKHLEYIISKEYNIDEEIKKNDVIILQSKINEITNIYNKSIIYFDILSTYTNE